MFHHFVTRYSASFTSKYVDPKSIYPPHASGDSVSLEHHKPKLISTQTMGFLSAIKSNQYIAMGIDGAMAVYGFVSENLWPIYSAGAILSAVFMLAVAQEKQILGDHLHGSPRSVQLRDGKRDETIIRAKKLLEEESSIAIKQDVWALPKAEFEKEYAAAHGDVATF